jgi:osmotically-inducible protein OsmY
MNDNIKFGILNNDELIALFDSLKRLDQEKIVKAGFRRSGNIILKEAKRNLEFGKKSINRRRVEKRFKMGNFNTTEDNITLQIGNTSYMAKWFEGGTKNRYTKTSQKKKSHLTGKMTGIHFLERATIAKGEEAVRELYNNIAIALNNLIKKYKK